MKIKPKILITGSSGTIGTGLFEKLLTNYDVVGFDRQSNKWHSNLDQLTIKGDLLRKQNLDKLPTDFDMIIHFAANAKVHDLVLKPDLALENIVTTYNILDFARKNKIKKFIFSSSREIYSNKDAVISKEKEVDLQLCESPYAASKMADEALVHSYSKCYGLDYLIFRFSNVYGKYDDSERFVPLMFRKMSNNEEVEVFGQDKLLDFTYIEDCLDGVVRAIERFPKNNTINISPGQGEKLIKVAQIMKKYLNSQSNIVIKPSRVGEVIQYVADISKAKELLDFNPQYSLEQGLELTINWYKKYGNGNKTQKRIS